MKEAAFYEKLKNKTVRCFLCAHRCLIAEKKSGFCGVRQNIDGVLYTHTYGKIIAKQVDPIEKKPLYHFLPGSTSLSIATVGCNFRCGFCQNWAISQRTTMGGMGQDFSAQEIAKAALENKCKSISYTYTEPTVFFEYALAVAKLAKTKGLYNNFVTNGYMKSECLEAIKPYLNAANVDLKFFKESSYKKNCSGSLKPVLDSIKLMHKLGIWVEVTTLVIPGENDTDEELTDIAQFLISVDRNIPWHISRFHPDYKFSGYHATPEVTLKKAQGIAEKAGLNYIYIGNVAGFGNNTHCHNCHKLLIKREIFDILEYNIKDSKCVFCQALIPGLF
jgi:pyruvate formate lyase activating enzyme